MVKKDNIAWRILADLRQNVYSRENTNNGHDYEHIERMLAMRQAFWPAIVRDEPAAIEYEIVLDLAIVFHDLNRSALLRGRGSEADFKRAQFAKNLMRNHRVSEIVAGSAILAIAMTFKKDYSAEPIDVRLLRDLDKADMGAIGIYRMAAVADSRKYGVFARPEDFDLGAPAIKGDENLDSFCADIKFCHRWWLKNEAEGDDWEIRTPAIRARVNHRFQFMKNFLKQIESEMREIELV